MKRKVLNQRFMALMLVMALLPMLIFSIIQGNESSAVAVTGYPVSIDFEHGIDFGEIVPGVEKVVPGDNDMSTPDMPTVRNLGSVDLSVTVQATPLKGTQFGKTIADFDAKFRGEKLFFQASQLITFSQPLAQGSTESINFSIFAPIGGPADVYTGTITISIGDTEFNIPTRAVITGVGTPPEVQWVWMLPDEDLNKGGTQVNITPNATKEIFAYIVACDPNGRDDVASVYVKVFHPDGSPKFQIYAVRLDCIADKFEIENALVKAAAAGLITQAEYGSIQQKIFNMEVSYMYKATIPLEYEQPGGSYRTENYAIDRAGNQDVLVTQLEVIKELNQPPVANAGADQIVYERDPVNFDGSQSYDPDGTIISYKWDFNGDGTFDYIETPNYAPDGTFDGKTTFTYSNSGLYTLTLIVRDNNRATGTDTATITVLEKGTLLGRLWRWIINKVNHLSEYLSSWLMPKLVSLWNKSLGVVTKILLKLRETLPDADKRHEEIERAESQGLISAQQANNLKILNKLFLGIGTVPSSPNTAYISTVYDALRYGDKSIMTAAVQSHLTQMLANASEDEYDYVFYLIDNWQAILNDQPLPEPTF